MDRTRASWTGWVAAALLLFAVAGAGAQTKPAAGSGTPAKGDTADHAARTRAQNKQRTQRRSARTHRQGGTSGRAAAGAAALGGLTIRPLAAGQGTGPATPPGAPPAAPGAVGAQAPPGTGPATPGTQTGPGGQPATPGAAPSGQGPGAPAAPGQNGGDDRGGRRGGFGRRGGDGGGFGALGPGATITMDFRGADIGNVLKFFAVAANWQVVPDAQLTGPVTIISPKPLTLDQAFQVLQSTLEVRGFTGKLEERAGTTILTILPFDRAVQNSGLMSRPVVGPDGAITGQGTLTPDEAKGQVMTCVIPINNADAATMARELTPLINRGASLVGSSGTNALIITDTAGNVQRIRDLVQALDRSASNNKVQRFALKHADATDVATAITNLFRQGTPAGRGAMGVQPGVQPGMPGGGGGFRRGGGGAGGPIMIGQGTPGGMVVPGQPQPGVTQTAGSRSAVIAVPDTRTNSVLVVASDDNLKQIADLIMDLDDEESSAMTTKIVKMRYASAQDVCDIINGILSGSMPGRMSQGASFGARVFGGGFGGFGGFGGQGSQGVASTDPFAKLVPDPRTNSIIVTATDERMKKIDALISQLDVSVPVETTTFVVPLKNAQAQDVAYTLGQAFGTSTGSGGGMFNPFGGFGYGGTNMNRNTNQRQNIQRRQGSGTSGFGRSVPMSGAPLPGGQEGNNPGGVPGVMTPYGFVPTSLEQPADEITRQFMIQPFGGGMFGMRGGQSNTPLYGRGQSGGYVNLLQLRQNVGVVADPNSNSLIITTTPDNMTAIQEVIDQLDIVPRQVMIEVIIAEASLDATQKLGFQFDAKGVGKFLGTEITQAGSSAFPVSGAGSVATNMASPIQQGIQYGIQALSGRFNALVQALATDDRVRILSTPKVFTSNNQQAEINITQRIPYITNTTLTNYGATSSYDFLDVGITLTVTPRITKDGLVTIDVVADASDLLGFDVVSSTIDSNGNVIQQSAPRTAQRTTDTTVSVRDNEIVALGGLMRDSRTSVRNKVPLLGDIPILGNLFRSTSTVGSKTELMIFMVPHVVDGDANSRAMTQKQATEIIKNIPELRKQQPNLDPKLQGPLPQHGQPAQPGQPGGPAQPPVPGK